MNRLAPGATAPDFALVDQDDQAVALSDLRGKPAILFFYPEAMTPGCTTEACDFRDSLAPLQAAGYEVLGISRDLPEKLREFRERDHLNFDLLSDPERQAHEAYGVWGEKQRNGETVIGVIRSTFVVDEDGRIVQALYDVTPEGHVAGLKQLLGVG
ncbi:thioredoxin-dependent thiol peroxidase [Microbacterium sp. SS28]|uniref:thioredoxin-dependent thiol peroxidase n=1 Tax=Microbacterium sp. SS28 TaxID=2919948 RepID=UPI001FAA9F4E|nr:thioredoxin-dependent thiol peroxidase [Microbacterium sp. SS28]